MFENVYTHNGQVYKPFVLSSHPRRLPHETTPADHLHIDFLAGEPKRSEEIVGKTLTNPASAKFMTRNWSDRPVRIQRPSATSTGSEVCRFRFVRDELKEQKQTVDILPSGQGH